MTDVSKFLNARADFYEAQPEGARAAFALREAAELLAIPEAAPQPGPPSA